MHQRSLAELIDHQDPAWPQLLHWAKRASNTAEILPVERLRGEKTLLALQVTTHSMLGAVALETGGILIDQGWLRVLGAGCERMSESLLSWNGWDDTATPPVLSDALIVAHDIVGGFFALNAGAFDGPSGNVWYFAPDRLVWEDLGLRYADFLQWALNGNLGQFYATQRWTGWVQEVSALGGDQGISFWPLLWAHADSIDARSRRVVSMRELWALQQDLSKQIKDLPQGASINIQVTE